MVHHSSVKLHFNQGHHGPGEGEAAVYLTTPLPFFGLFADSAFPLVQMMLKRGSLCCGGSFARRPRSHFHKYCHISPPTHSTCAWTRSPPLLPPKGSQEEGAACREVRDVFMGLERKEVHCGCEVGFACGLWMLAINCILCKFNGHSDDTLLWF